MTNTLLKTGYYLGLQAILPKIICKIKWREYLFLLEKVFSPYMKLKYLTKNLPLLDHLLWDRVATCSK
jgi:hypothetical protein